VKDQYFGDVNAYRKYGLLRAFSRAGWNLVPGATYFEAQLEDSLEARIRYFNGAWETFARCDLIFFDPDNGIEVQKTLLGRRGSAKYVYWDELKEAWDRGHSLLVYQHFPRVPHDRFLVFLSERIAEELPGARVSALATPYVAFFLAQQARHASALAGALQQLSLQWPGQISVPS